MAVGQLPRQVAQPLAACARGGLLGAAPLIVGLLCCAGLDQQQRGVAIEDQAGAVGDVERRRAQADHGGDAARARQDRRVAGRPAIGRREAGHARRQLDGLGGGQVGGDDDRARWHAGQRWPAIERPADLGADRVDIGGALAQVGVVQRRDRGPHLRHRRIQRGVEQLRFLAHQPRDLVAQRRVLDQQRLELEDPGLILVALLALRLGDGVQPLDRRRLGRSKALQPRIWAFAIGCMARRAARQVTKSAPEHNTGRAADTTEMRLTYGPR